MQTTDRGHTEVAAERKWIRLQQVGVVLLFLMPFAILFVALTRDAILVSLVFLGFLAAGNICVRHGKKKVMKLRDKEDDSNG